MTDTPTVIVKREHATDTVYKAVDYIETYTGRMFFPLAPTVEMVSIIDIAHALSNQCRYGGHTSSFYSTAQHCCILASYVENVGKGSALDCLQILMHDAAEAYLVDMQRPIKQHMPQFRKWDHDIQMVIREWLGLRDIPIPEWQDEIDSRIINDERMQIMSDSGNDWQHSVEPLGVKVDPWAPAVAEKQFLMRYAAYTSALADGNPAYIREEWGITGTRLQATYSDDPKVEDLVEVDLRGNVGRIKLRGPNGMLIRDPRAGSEPRPLTKWMHGRFTLVTGGKNGN